MDKISLWAVITDGPKFGCFPLQKRAGEKFENGVWKKQSFPGVLKPLVAGKGNPGESPITILYRKTEEEVGKEFLAILRGKTGCTRKFYHSSEEYWDKSGDKVTDYNFIVRISHEELGKVELHSGAEPNLVFLSGKDAERIKTTKEFGNGIIQENDLVMFPDHLKIFRLMVR